MANDPELIAEDMTEAEVAEEIEQLEEVYETDYEIGQDNTDWFGLDFHGVVFAVSASLIILFVGLSLAFPQGASSVLSDLRVGIGNHFDGLFLVAGNIFVLFCLSLIVLPVGSIRIGGEDATPDFSRLSWFAMLFAAGMGIGLMFWSVAEPVGYFTEWAGTPLNMPGYTEASAQAALGATMYHWGLHPWAIYAVVALALAFFSFNKGLPLTIRSTFYPLLGERVWGPIGHVLDTLAVLATLFGLATSLGFGAKQAASGIAYLTPLTGGLGLQVLIIAVVTAVALISVMRGINRGVRVLSNINMGLALLLLVFVAFAGSVVAVLGHFATTVSGYVSYALPLSNPFGREDTAFYHGWTIFFWAWWISWSPFVGSFIARVSRGRTVREFLITVLLVPTVLTSFWMATFGGTGITKAASGSGALGDGISDSSLALFQMLAEMPFSGVTSLIAIVLVLVFFVTSSDSGSLVIDSITAGGKTNSPKFQRLFWVVTQGLIAAVLLTVGGAGALDALQAGAVSSGLPFVFVLLAMCVSLAMGLHHERQLLTMQAVQAVLENGDQAEMPSSASADHQVKD